MDTHPTAHNDTQRERQEDDAPARAHSPAIPLSTTHPLDAVRVGVAAKMAGVGRRTIYEWIERKLVDVRYSPSGSVLVVVSSLVKDTRPEGVGRRSITRKRSERLT